MIQFVENLNALGHWLFLHFGRISIEVAILAALVGAAIVALRIKRPAIRYAFWCLVLIKPAIALLATSPVSLYWYLQPEPTPTPIVMPAAPPMARPPMRPAGPVSPMMPPMRPLTAAPRPAPTPPPPPPEPTAWETFNIYGVGCAVWLAGVFVLFVRLVVGFAYVGFLRQSSRRQKVGVLAEAVADLRRELKIRRRVRVAISYVAHGPVLAGIVRPTILIPNDLAEDLSQEQARLIIGHELAHVKRWDNLLLLIQRIIEVFFFFHPVIWLTGWLMRREAEAAADDKIISVGGRPADYADALARAAEVRIGLTRRMLVNTFAASESDHARRVRRILNGRVVKTSLAMGVIAVIALIVIAIVGLPGPAERKPDTKPEGDKEMVSHIKTTEQLAAGVKREGGKVWIDGVPDGTFGISWDMLARAMQTLLAYRGEKADFDELLAYSGDAFNLCHGSNWQGVSYLCAPTNIVGNMAEAYGYEYETIHNGYPFETMEDLERPARLVITERALSRIRAEIEAGRPPLVGGAEDHCGSWTLAVGYDREGPLLRHVGDHQPNRWTPIRGVAPGSTDEDFGHWNGRFRGTIRDGFVGGWQDNPAYLIKQKKAHTPTRRENVLAALARAVQLHRAPTTHIGWSGGVDYHFGRRAYEQWAAELHKLDFPADVEKALPDEAYDWYEMGNMAIQADQIVRGRSAAATFCEKAVEVLPGAKDHLLAAAQAYRQEAAIAAEAFAVFLEGTDEQRVAWLSDEAKREAGVTAIAQMLEKEQLAVGHVEAALAIVGVAAPGTGIAGGGRPMQAVQSTPVFDIPKLADMDASAAPDQWGDRGLRVDVMTPFGPRMPTSQFGARFRLGWDDTGLWLLATVTDDEFHSAGSIEKLWANEADLILLYVIREKGEFARILIEPGMTADQPSPRIITDAEVNGLGVRVTREKTDGGYVLQAWVPWREVGIEPADGAELRAQVIVLDVDKAGEDIQMGGALWYPAVGTPQNTGISHRLRLASEPSAPQVAVVEAADDRITITAAPEQVGKTVTVIEGGRTLAEVMLAADDATGYAVAAIPLPLPPLSHPLAQPTVMLDGHAIGSLNPIQLSGYGMEQDTLSLAIEAAAKALGRDTDFETIACLSSNAFAPMLSVGEDCTSWWMNEAWMADRCIETVARRVGLEIREIKLPEAEGTWDDKAAMAAHRRKIAPILREIMAGGEIIVISGGWEARQEHGFVPWGWAGIITEARDDGTILGVHPDNARTDNAIYVPGRLWALSLAEPTLSAHEADLIALQQAVNRIRSADRFQSDGPARYGLAAMDAYIEHMRTVPGFCAGCFERAPDRAWTDANDSARAVHGVAKTAASYLRRRIGTFKVEARPHIEAAARHYDRIILLLHPALTGEGGRSYQQWINGNLVAQKRHADEVLVPVRAQLAAAADAMARALAAEGIVVTTADSPSPSAATPMPDFEALELYEGRGTDDPFSVTIQAVARLYGIDADYETVACLSSNAFAPMLDPAWTWLTDNAGMGDRCLASVAGRLGLDIRELELPDPPQGPMIMLAAGKREFYYMPSRGSGHRTGADRARRIAPILREAMANGQVIVAAVGLESADHGYVWTRRPAIITEIRGDGTILAADPGIGESYSAVSPCGRIYALSLAGPTLSAHEADLVMLQQAVNRIRGAERFQSGPRDQYGLAAVETWAEWMRMIPEGTSDESQPERFMHAAHRIATPVHHGAQVAAGHLRSRVEAFNDEARPHIESAADHYESIAELLRPALTGEGGPSYQQIMADPELQNAHAEELLVAKDHFVEAANAMERALAAEGVSATAAESPGDAPVLPDYDRLELEGDHDAKDSFSLVMQTVARTYGIEADYETIYALSTNGFAPEISVSLMSLFGRMHGRGQSLDLVAAYLGLDVRLIPSNSVGQALAAGAVVITDRHLSSESDVYCSWGIVLAMDENENAPVIQRAHGAAQRGPTADVVDDVGVCWAVTPGTPTLSQKQADVIMLQRAVSRIWQDDTPFITVGVVFGLYAMDDWIEQMAGTHRAEDEWIEQVGGDPRLEDDLHWLARNAWVCALYTYQGATDTAAYLRGRMDTFPDDARPHVTRVAARYERIAELLEPFTVWEEGEGYQTIMGDLEKRKAHANSVLRPIKAELAAAADDIAKALTAMGVRASATWDDPIAALAQEFTAEQLTKLAAWSNLYGNLEVVLREAATNPEFLELFRQQLALGSISAEAATIRGYIGRLEPAEDTYLTHVEMIVRAIAAGQWGEDQPPLLLPAREKRLEALRGILADWVDGVSEADALAKRDDNATVERIYGLLGEHTADKAEAVAGLVGKFSPDGDCDKKFYEWEAMKDKTTVAQKMAHHITMLDKPLWHLEYSLSVTLAGIGHGESIGDWRTPGGHLGWKNWINPKDLPRIKTIAKALEVWLADGEAEGEVAEIIVALGERDAYREKAWLAGCLLHYLRTDGARTDEFVEQLKTDWLPLGPEGFTMDELTDSLVTGDIGWYWARPTTSHQD